MIPTSKAMFNEAASHHSKLRLMQWPSNVPSQDVHAPETGTHWNARPKTNVTLYMMVSVIKTYTAFLNHTSGNKLRYKKRMESFARQSDVI